MSLEFSIEEKFLKANLEGGFENIKKLASELGISESDTNEIIKNIRLKFRRDNKINNEQEVQGENFVDFVSERIDGKENENIEILDDLIIINNFPNSKYLTITDRLNGKYNNLLINNLNGESIFFGNLGFTEEINKFLNLNEDCKIISSIKDGNENSICFNHTLEQFELNNFIKEIFDDMNCFKEVDGEKFYQSIKEAKEKNSHGSYVDLHEEYDSTRNYIFKNGVSGYSIDGCDLISVYKNPELANKYGVKGVMSELVTDAVKNGAKTGDCYTGCHENNLLIDNYMGCYALPVAKVKFNEEFVENWDFENDGRPDVVAFILVEQNLEKQKKLPDLKYDNIKENIPCFEDYDEMIELRNNLVEEFINLGYEESVNIIKSGKLMELIKEDSKKIKLNTNKNYVNR